MKTDELVGMLAGGAAAGKATVGGVGRRYLTALGCATVVALLLMIMWLGVRRDIADAVLLPMFWVKLAFPGVLLAGALMTAKRLSHPGVRLGHVMLVIAAPVLAMWLLAAVLLLGAGPEARDYLVFGESWSVCPFYITTLSLPAFVAAFWVIKGYAPTRPVLAGAVSGLLAGALGALVYSVHCPEMTAPFIGIWYLLGMLIPAAAGAVLGPRLLRW